MKKNAEAKQKTHQNKSYVNCPICKKQASRSPQENPFRPFCSNRCRLIDLAAWLDGSYSLSDPMSLDKLGDTLGNTEDSANNPDKGESE